MYDINKTYEHLASCRTCSYAHGKRFYTPGDEYNSGTGYICYISNGIVVFVKWDLILEIILGCLLS